MRTAVNVGRGVVAGVAAGVVWWAVEAVVNRALGGLLPGEVAADILAIDVALGAVAGAVVVAVLVIARREVGAAALALGLAAAYALFRVYDPPGLGAEAVFAIVAAGAAVIGVLLAAGEGLLAFAHLLVLTTVAVTLAGWRVDEAMGSRRWGEALPFVLAVVPIVAVAMDAAVGFVVRRRAPRFALEVVAAALAAVVWGSPLATAPIDDPIVTAVPPSASAPDVILVTLDTTRADHLSTYGYDRATSPHLTTFAADALLFTEARSPAAWTLPGHASLFTGMYPSRHGAHFAGTRLPGESRDGRPMVAFPLAPSAVTMAEALRDRGYQTGGFVANFSYLYRDFGVAQGFGRYEDAPRLLFRLRPVALRLAQQVQPPFCLAPIRSAHEINAAALAWLDRASPSRPVFLFVNYMEAHQPRLAASPYDRWSRELPEHERLARRNLYYEHAVRNLPDVERRFIAANYDGQVASMDEALGELLEALRARGRYEKALVIVTADHGEFLGEHEQMGHIGQMLYEPVLHIPLVVKYPGAEHPRGRSTNPVQLVDVLPTVLEATGAPLPPGVQGEPLGHVDHATLAEEDIDPYLVARYGSQYDRSVRVLYDGDYKLIRTSRGESMLFDLARDPEERNDLAAAEPERAATLLRRLEATLDTMIARN
jgi:arylsulfatase A-like enzyme